MAALLASTALVGCRQDMHNQAKHEPLEASRLFSDGASARRLPPHTVAQGFLQEDRALHTGVGDGGEWIAELPVELDRELLSRGRERFEIFCSPCHDRTGGGRGMIVQRGFQQPPSYWDSRLLGMPIGYFYDVVTNGYGQMSGYAAQMPVHDRWAVAAWVRVLQRARTVEVARLAEQEQRWVDEGHSVGAAEGGAGTGHGSVDSKPEPNRPEPNRPEPNEVAPSSSHDASEPGELR
jgi:mono/diheme cytochrome c family protein